MGSNLLPVLVLVVYPRPLADTGLRRVRMLASLRLGAMRTKSTSTVYRGRDSAPSRSPTEHSIQSHNARETAQRVDL